MAAESFVGWNLSKGQTISVVPPDGISLRLTNVAASSPLTGCIGLYMTLDGETLCIGVLNTAVSQCKLAVFVASGQEVTLSLRCSDNEANAAVSVVGYHEVSDELDEMLQDEA
eukprot:NODE_8445_length_550_cov_40.770686_g8422_i0.p1 GENE.NODE_8445_length_550_cov_40.770686_g8422_i0~~NODE_8445_length_550_cov_40.770686_g8422_i0.p1  ORF type:complete len:113 (+),score=12.00 NODE_8445_length_550_cov_40.770686_g8422_i0:88-426(+)